MNRLRELRELQGITMKEMAAKLNLPYTTYVNYEKGTREPSSETLIQIANYHHVSLDYLAGRDCQPQQAPASIPPGCTPIPEMTTVPLIGQIACGTPILADENKIKDISLPASWHADFALTCKGESMMPTIHDGDVIAIRSQPTVEQGQIAAVLIDGMETEATLKRVYLFPDRLILQAENPAFPPIILEGEEINTAHIEGRAVGLCRNL